MKFSIIIATYAPGAQLSRAISSILSQTFQDFEIVIQDNLSTDPETLSVFEKFAEKISLKSTSDSGIYDAFNQALKRCSGDWILFLGADDTLADDTVLEKICESGTNAGAVAGSGIEESLQSERLDRYSSECGNSSSQARCRFSPAHGEC